MTTAAVRIEYPVLEPVDIETGHWCPRCHLSTLVKVTLASQAVIAGRVGPLKLTTGWRCSNGHGWLPAPRS